MMAWLMGLKSIAPEALRQRLGDPRLAVFDVNAIPSWRQAHVPGARRLDHEHFTAADLPADKQTELVFYCSNPMCRKAPLAARRAKQMGYEHALVMSAGIAGWLSAKLPTEAGA